MAEKGKQKEKPAEKPAQEQPKPGAPTPQQVQENLPGLTVGLQTRGADGKIGGGVRLDQQKTPAGKELIGMRSGVPIYADVADVYSSQVEKLTPAYSAPLPPKPDFGGLMPKQFSVTDKPTPSTTFGDSIKNPIPKISSYGAPKQPAKVTEPPAPSIEALREQYQKDAAAARQEIEQKYKQQEQPKYFSKEYADRFRTAQAAADQRAKERIAYGGRPVRDTSNSMAVANNAAAAMRAEAARPELASKEEIESWGFDAPTVRRLWFGVGENGEDIIVTPEYLAEYAASKGIFKRPGPTFKNSRSNKPSYRTSGKPGFF